MECTLCNIYIDKFVTFDRDGLFVAEIKSSTKTSTGFVYVMDAFSLCLGLSV